MVPGGLRFFCVIFPAVFLIKYPAMCRGDAHALRHYHQFRTVRPDVYRSRYGTAHGVGRADAANAGVFYRTCGGHAAARAGAGAPSAENAHHCCRPGFYRHRPLSGCPAFRFAAACTSTAASWACGNIVIKCIGNVNSLSLVRVSLSALLVFTLASFALYGGSGVAQHIGNLSLKGAGILFLAYIAAWPAIPAGARCRNGILPEKSRRLRCRCLLALPAGFTVPDERLGVWYRPGILTVVAVSWCMFSAES